ncbi:MAG: hypothetical protein PHG89_00895 [Gallionella sp.]|nr:hypothetical protein [Gallionella sp.]
MEAVRDMKAGRASRAADACGERLQRLGKTTYLLRSPANAKRLSNAVAAINNGKVKERALLK